MGDILKEYKMRELDLSEDGTYHLKDIADIFSNVSIYLPNDLIEEIEKLAPYYSCGDNISGMYSKVLRKGVRLLKEELEIK